MNPKFVCLLSIFLLSGLWAIGCGKKPASSHDNEPQPSFDSYCDINPWTCDTFEDGPSLSTRRHGHQTVVLDHERVLLIGGWQRIDDTRQSKPLDTCEIVDPLTDDVREVDCFARIRRNPAVIRLQDGSVLAISGTDENGNRKTTTEHFDPHTERWTRVASLQIDYRIRELSPLMMADGRVLLLHVEDQFGAHNPSIPGATIYDPETDIWSPIAMPEIEVDTLHGALLPDGNLLLVLAHPDDLTKNPPEPEEGEEPLHPGHRIYLGVLDLDTDEWNQLATLQTRGAGFTPNVTWLPEREFFLINIYGNSYQPTVGYLFDPDSYFFEQFYARHPIPGQVSTVLPGDKILFHSNQSTTYYDIDADEWIDFEGYPPGLIYSSVVQLDDCRLFGSGERTLYSEDGPADASLRGVDTAYCTPKR